MYQNNVNVRRPPHSFNSRHNASPADLMGTSQLKTAGAAATPWTDILGGERVVSYVVMRFTGGDAYVSFSDGRETELASNKDWLVKDGEVWEWLCCGKPDQFMRLLRAGSTDVTCTYYLSDQLPTYEDITFDVP